MATVEVVEDNNAVAAPFQTGDHVRAHKTSAAGH
jgi:hypothetical protein